MAKVPFTAMRVNVTPEGREVIFPYGPSWYRLKWADVPERFKVLYVAKLRLNGYDVPDDLKPYERDSVTLDDLTVEVDLTKAEEVTGEYPL